MKRTDSFDRRDLGFHDPERRATPPPPAGKIGAVHGTAPARDGALREPGDRRPRGAVVDVVIERHPAPEACDEPVVFDEVHPSVTRSARSLLERFPDRVLELVAIGPQVLPGVGGAPIFDVNFLLGILPNQAPGSLQENLPAIGPGVYEAKL